MQGFVQRLLASGAVRRERGLTLAAVGLVPRGRRAQRAHGRGESTGRRARERGASKSSSHSGTFSEVVEPLPASRLRTAIIRASERSPNVPKRSPPPPSLT